MSTTDEIKKTYVLKGVGVSPGIASGKAFLFDPLGSEISFYKLNDKSLISQEIKRFKTALKESEKQLREIKNGIHGVIGPEPLYIIDVHIMLLRDKAFIKHTVEHIRQSCVNAEWAVRMTTDKYRELFDLVEDEYIRSRFSDIQYVGKRIIRNLSGKRNAPFSEINEDVIVVASDLSPADTAQMMVHKVLGFATDMGGKTSHTAIVARSIEIPAVVGLKNITRIVKTNDDLILDGTSGLIIVNPDPEVARRYQEKKRHYETVQEDFLKYARLPAITKDKYRVDIGSNIEFIEEIPSAVLHGAEGIGLYRTEFIYINRDQLPLEEEHFSHYRQVVGIEGLGWSTIRTFDLGGDKFTSDPKLAKEMNPQLGLRAIRFCLKEVEQFKVQLRAILRASAYGKTRIMFPMISGIEEIREAKRIFNDVMRDLIEEDVPVGRDIEIGVMIEVPSAGIVAEDLAKEVDFFSIGTNDLIQYVLAIDRINERVGYLYEPLHPAILRLIRQIVAAGHRQGIRVAMCGEMAGDPLYSLILLGLELDELSMNPLAIPRMKKIIQNSTLQESRLLLDQVVKFNSATEIRDYVEHYMRQRFPEEFPGNGQ
ncbi:MAG: Phosphoenolpyruvate-protein phosphotransferase [Syntrophus sp. PtaB.Bin001]|nr:MAG: Phosphoenolpyruvate-protein phosphotransferase [Syntrophus sp. PtaB.Bin001]